MFRLSLAALLPLVLPACSSEVVRLYELREAEPGTLEAEAYQRLREAVDLANAFLEDRPEQAGLPGDGAYYLLGFTDVLVHFRGHGRYALRISTAGWGDLRTVAGDGLHPTSQGILADHGARREHALGNDFLSLPREEMAAALLRGTVPMLRIKQRGGTDYWVNYSVRGLVEAKGWGAANPESADEHALETAYWEWLRDRRAVADPS